jgi:5-methylcytosine-specific restriction protein B
MSRGQSLANEPLPVSDPHLLTARRLANSFGGVVLAGTARTGKSYYARRIGLALTEGDRSRLRFTQFHPGYRYEDFVQGFVPDDERGAVLEARLFYETCRDASEDSERCYVVVIDDLHRQDPARVFGETLGYLERAKRGSEFDLVSGTKCAVPANLVFIATLDPSQEDATLSYARVATSLARIDLKPDSGELREILHRNGMSESLSQSVVAFFEHMNETGRQGAYEIGHGYFAGASDEPTLRDIWEHQLYHLLLQHHRPNSSTMADLARRWESLFPATGG